MLIEARLALGEFLNGTKFFDANAISSTGRGSSRTIPESQRIWGNTKGISLTGYLSAKSLGDERKTRFEERVTSSTTLIQHEKEKGRNPLQQPSP